MTSEKTEAKKTASANRRTRRKATGGAKPDAGTGPVYVDGIMYMCEKDLLKYELAQSRVGNAYQAVNLKRAEIERLQYEHADKIRKAREEMTMIVQADKQVREVLLTLQKELEAVYELDFSKIAYDDITGKIEVIGEGPVMEPGWEPPAAIDTEG